MKRAFAAAVVAVFSLVVFCSAHADSQAFRLVIEENESGSAIFAELPGEDGATRRVLLRQSPATARVERSGADPSGRALFATWSEAGRRFQAFSRDAGRSWSEARAIATELRLLDGATAPGEAMPDAPAALRLRAGSGVFVVQFASTGLPEFRAALAARGATLLAHLPHNAHIVRVPASGVSALAGLDFVERVEPFHPFYRVAAPVRGWLEAEGTEKARLRVMAFTWGESGKRAIANAAMALGATVTANWPSGHIVELEATPAQARELAHHDEVMWVEFWTPAETDMDLVREDAGTNWLETNFGWCGDGVRGEVMDSGVQDDHMDFDGIILHGGHDTASHGTSTYGIVFGNGDRDGDGSAKGLGHMPCAQGIFADYGNVGDRFAHTQELKNDPYWASFQTNSWGDARTLEYTSKSHEMDDIIWRLDIAILNSQSNSGNQQSRPQAWAKNVISVGGIKHKDTLDEADDEWGSGASVGPAADGRIKPDIHYWYDNIYTTTTGNGYTSTFGGTSGATPEAAGVIGLMLQMWSENVWGTDPEGSTVFERQPHASTIKALAINNGKQYPFSGEGHDLRRVHQGWGRPNVQIAHDRAARSYVSDEEFPLEIGELSEWTIVVEEGEAELKITMVYPDPPGTTNSTLHRINDLNLKVISPSGTTYWGNNGLLGNNYSTPGGSPNGLDTVENVFVENPESGEWTVEVSAAEINQDAHTATPEDDAVFALVVTGGVARFCEPPAADFTITPNPANIAEEITFDSTVSGGSGAPYRYEWDFDGDGTVDSTEADPVYVYNRAYTGPVLLVVNDAIECTTEVEHPIEVRGANVRTSTYTELTELEGNGNGALDPGETWSVKVVLENAGDGDATEVTASVALNPASPGPVVLLDTHSSYGDIAAGTTATSASAYSFRIGSAFPCGENILLDVVGIRSVTPDIVYPDNPSALRLLVGGSGPQQSIWTEGFETDTGWSEAGGEWQRGAPQGLGGSASQPGWQIYPDPVSAFDGSAVAGTDLSGIGPTEGAYESLVSATYTSPALDMSDAILVELDFMRWLNVLPNDTASFEVSSDGTNWTTLFTVSDGSTENAWVPQNFDLSLYADRQPAFRMRFKIESDNVGGASGWNVDGMEIFAVTKDSCEPFGQPLPGESGGLVVTLEASGELTLSWSADCGSGSRYGVYRGDLAAGLSSLAPEPGLCDVSATEALLPAGAGTADFFLIVPNDGTFEGSYGVDGNTVRRSAPAGACYPQDAIDACAP